MQGNDSQRGLYWLVGGVMALLLVGCSLVAAAGFLVVRTSQGSASPDPARTTANLAISQSAALQSTPRPVFAVATPSTGVDYESAVLANIYTQVNPSVVNVTVLDNAAALQALMPQGIPPGAIDPNGLYSVSSGSGFVWDEEGRIVTNNHVVEGADEVQVTFADGTIAVAKVLGTDADSDLAVLEVESDGYVLVPLRRGRLDDLFVGMRVAAIGNPFGLQGTLTSGIVSALGRSIPARTSFSIPDAIQTDAAINPGNSGGPLLNEQGELIGVNAQIRSEERANSGVGFAIPVTIVERVVPELIASGRYQHAYMGISARTFSPICAEVLGLPKTVRGAVVIEVLARTPAARAGLQGGSQPSETRYPDICPTETGGDLITAIEDQPVTTFDDILVYLQRYTSPGDTVQLTILRDGAADTVDLTLAPRPVND